MTDFHYCGTCVWHKFDRKYGDWLCTNEESENFAMFTGYDDMDTCEEWESKDEKDYEERLSEEAQMLDEYLSQYRICTIRKRSLERRRREILKEFGYPLSAVTYDGMPHGSSSGVGCEALPLKLAEIEDKIDRQISENTRVLLQTIEIISLLPENSMDRVILEHRYIDCYGWRRICEAVPIGKTPAVRRWRRGLHTLIQKKRVREIITEYRKELEAKEDL